jgi:hypothetical protein
VLIGLHVDIDKGLVLLAVEPYDEAILDDTEALPERRYRRRAHTWILLARHGHLA